MTEDTNLGNLNYLDIFERILIEPFQNLAVHESRKAKFMRMLEDWNYLNSKITIREFTLMSNKELSIVMQNLLEDYYSENRNVSGTVNFKKKINSNQTIKNKKILTINEILKRNKVMNDRSNKHGSIYQDKLNSLFIDSPRRSLYNSKKINPFLFLSSEKKNKETPKKTFISFNNNLSPDKTKNKTSTIPSPIIRNFKVSKTPSKPESILISSRRSSSRPGNKSALQFLEETIPKILVEKCSVLNLIPSKKLNDTVKKIDDLTTLVKLKNKIKNKLIDQEWGKYKATEEKKNKNIDDDHIFYTKYLNRDIKDKEIKNFHEYILKDVDISRKDDKSSSDLKNIIEKNSKKWKNSSNDNKIKRTENTMIKNHSCSEFSHRTKFSIDKKKFYNLEKNCCKSINLSKYKIKSYSKKRVKADKKFGNLMVKGLSTKEQKYFERYLKKEIYDENKNSPNDDIFEINLKYGGGCYLRNKEKLFSIKYNIEEILKK